MIYGTQTINDIDNFTLHHLFNKFIGSGIGNTTDGTQRIFKETLKEFNQNDNNINNIIDTIEKSENFTKFSRYISSKCFNFDNKINKKNSLSTISDECYKFLNDNTIAKYKIIDSTDDIFIQVFIIIQYYINFFIIDSDIIVDIGYKNNNSGHCVLLYIANDYLILSNTGEGIEFHQNIDNQQYFCICKKNNINRQQINDILAQTITYNILYSKKNKNETPGISKIYDILFNIFGRNNDKLYFDNGMVETIQVSGSCTYSSMITLLKYLFDKSVFDTYYNFLTIKCMKQVNEYINNNNLSMISYAFNDILYPDNTSEYDKLYINNLKKYNNFSDNIDFFKNTNFVNVNFNKTLNYNFDHITYNIDSIYYLIDGYLAKSEYNSVMKHIYFGIIFHILLGIYDNPIYADLTELNISVIESFLGMYIEMRKYTEYDTDIFSINLVLLGLILKIGSDFFIFNTDETFDITNSWDDIMFYRFRFHNDMIQKINQIMYCFPEPDIVAGIVIKYKFNIVFDKHAIFIKNTEFKKKLFNLILTLFTNTVINNNNNDFHFESSGTIIKNNSKSDDRFFFNYLLFQELIENQNINNIESIKNFNVPKYQYTTLNITSIWINNNVVHNNNYIDKLNDDLNLEQFFLSYHLYNSNELFKILLIIFIFYPNTFYKYKNNILFVSSNFVNSNLDKLVNGIFGNYNDLDRKLLRNVYDTIDIISDICKYNGIRTVLYGLVSNNTRNLIDNYHNKKNKIVNINNFIIENEINNNLIKYYDNNIFRYIFSTQFLNNHLFEITSEFISIIKTNKNIIGPKIIINNDKLVNLFYDNQIFTLTNLSTKFFQNIIPTQNKMYYFVNNNNKDDILIYCPTFVSFQTSKELIFRAIKINDNIKLFYDKFEVVIDSSYIFNSYLLNMWISNINGILLTIDNNYYIMIFTKQSNHFNTSSIWNPSYGDINITINNYTHNSFYIFKLHYTYLFIDNPDDLTISHYIVDIIFNHKYNILKLLSCYLPLIQKFDNNFYKHIVNGYINCPFHLYFSGKFRMFNIIEKIRYQYYPKKYKNEKNMINFEKIFNIDSINIDNYITKTYEFKNISESNINDEFYRKDYFNFLNNYYTCIINKNFDEFYESLKTKNLLIPESILYIRNSNFIDLFLSNYDYFFVILINKVINDLLYKFKNITNINCNEFKKLISLFDKNVLYNGNRNFCIYLFEIIFGGIIRQTQYDMFKQIKIKNTTTYDIHQLVMGGGKTSVILPLLIIDNINEFDIIFVIQPSHLVDETFNIIFSYMRLFNNVQLIKNIFKNNKNNKNDSIINYFDDYFEFNQKKIFVIDDSSFKFLKLEILIKNKNILNSLVIFDEFDDMYDPHKAELNLPIDNKQYINDDTYDDFIINYVINGDIYIGDDFIKNKIMKIIDNSDDIINRKFGFISDSFIAIPHKTANQPMMNSQFSDIYYTKCYTCILYFRFGFRKQDAIEIIKFFFDLFNSLDESIIYLVYENIFNILNINSDIIKIANYQNAIIDNILINMNKNKNYFLHFYCKNIIFSKYIKQNNEFLNCSFMDVMVKSTIKYKIGFTGTVNFELPMYIDDNYEFTKFEYDKTYAYGSVISAITNITNKLSQFIFYNKLIDFTFIYRLFILNNISCFIDAGSHFKNYTSIDFIKNLLLFMNNNNDKIYIDYKFVFVYDSKKYYITRDNLDKMIYYDDIGFDNNVFIYYSEKDCVGVDIKQSIFMNGLVSLSSHNTLDQVAQSIFRMRNTNYGHIAYFCHNINDNMNHFDIINMLIENNKEYIKKNEFRKNLQNFKFILRADNNIENFTEQLYNDDGNFKMYFENKFKNKLSNQVLSKLYNDIYNGYDKSINVVLSIQTDTKQEITKNIDIRTSIDILSIDKFKNSKIEININNDTTINNDDYYMISDKIINYGSISIIIDSIEYKLNDILKKYNVYFSPYMFKNKFFKYGNYSYNADFLTKFNFYIIIHNDRYLIITPNEYTLLDDKNNIYNKYDKNVPTLVKFITCCKFTFAELYKLTQNFDVYNIYLPLIKYYDCVFNDYIFIEFFIQHKVNNYNNEQIKIFIKKHFNLNNDEYIDILFKNIFYAMQKKYKLIKLK